MSEENNTEEFMIYPNPASEFLCFNTANISQLEIRDVLGKLIFSLPLENITATTITVNVQEWNKGIYIVSAVTNRKTTTAMFIKQ
jgi:hypothetical protein